MTPVLTNHAIERYHERVAPNHSRSQARAALQRFVCSGRLRPTPRHWMSGTHAEPGVTFVYWAAQPRTCAILRGRVVVTVVTADLGRRPNGEAFEWRKERDRHQRRRQARDARREARLAHQSDPCDAFLWLGISVVDPGEEEANWS